ncbi:hypothetical protein ACFSPU_03975 [Haoranjiania flava]|uniref:Uncharacterized protein n=1 Tax=Haoranjiania flava TaxID=1856322 RepID=A0AAE3IN29_9BACT|nr:hypothetical protein [Haoranjiania flava]MCU7695122.1 hypothetical protein [Haoranjiania flava]
MGNIFKQWLILLLIVILPACNNAVSRLYGIRSSKFLDDNEIAALANKFKISDGIYTLDTNFISALNNFEYSEQLKNNPGPHPVKYKFRQPLLIVVFNNATGRQLSFLNNCYAPGFPNLKWRTKNNMQHFPAIGGTPTDTLVNLNDIVTYLKPIQAATLKEKKYSMLVFWNQYLGRQTGRYLNEVHSYIIKNKVKDISDIYYVNNDNFLYAIEHNR